MKKTLIASAIAAATFSGSVLAQESNLPTVYGNIQYAFTYEDVENGDHGSAFVDNGSTLGIKHSHELMPGIEGFFKAELEFDADDKANSDGLSGFDEAYIGVKGDSFGQLWVGSDDSTYETAIDEISNYYEYAAQNIGSGSDFYNGIYDTGEGDLIQYRTPSFGGLVLAAAMQFNGDSDGKEKSFPYQLAALYEMGGLELAVAMDSNDGDLRYSSNSDVSYNNENTYGVRGSYNLDNLRLTAQFQTRKDVGDTYGLFAGYTLGANVLAASWERGEPEDLEEFDVFTVQALHNLSDNMYVYVEGYLGNGDEYADAFGGDGDERSDLAVGGVYYF